jgi:hypothetical protein
MVFRRISFRGGHWKEKLSKYNILQETPGTLLIMHKITNMPDRNEMFVFPKKKNYHGMKNYA